jgi:hypothetical protein
MLNENTTPKPSTAVLDRAEDIYQAMKSDAGRNFVKRYGKEAENVMRGRAMNSAKKQVKTMNEEKLKEIIKKKLATPPVKETFSKEYDTDPALKGGQKQLPDELQAAIIKKSVKEELDYEGEMAKSELLNVIKNAEELFNMLEEDTQLEAWVQSKLTKANEYLESVYQYLKYQSIPKQMDEREDLYTLDK